MGFPEGVTLWEPNAERMKIVDAVRPHEALNLPSNTSAAGRFVQIDHQTVLLFLPRAEAFLERAAPFRFRDRADTCRLLSRARATHYRICPTFVIMTDRQGVHDAPSSCI